MARRYWKPSKAQIQREREATQKYLNAMDQKRKEVLAGYPEEYQEAIVTAYCLMKSARDSLVEANSCFTITEEGVKQWKSEIAVSNYNYYKAESDDFYAKYLAQKETISQQYGIHSDTVAEHVKTIYVMSAQVDNLLMKGAFK